MQENKHLAGQHDQRRHAVKKKGPSEEALAFTKAVRFLTDRSFMPDEVVEQIVRTLGVSGWKYEEIYNRLNDLLEEDGSVALSSINTTNDNVLYRSGDYKKVMCIAATVILPSGGTMRAVIYPESISDKVPLNPGTMLGAFIGFTNSANGKEFTSFLSSYLAKQDKSGRNTVIAPRAGHAGIMQETASPIPLGLFEKEGFGIYANTSGGSPEDVFAEEFYRTWKNRMTNVISKKELRTPYPGELDRKIIKPDYVPEPTAGLGGATYYPMSWLAKFTTDRNDKIFIAWLDNYSELSALYRFPKKIEKHLPGRHDQKRHAGELGLPLGSEADEVFALLRGATDQEYLDDSTTISVQQAFKSLNLTPADIKDFLAVITPAMRKNVYITNESDSQHYGPNSFSISFSERINKDVYARPCARLVYNGFSGWQISANMGRFDTSTSDETKAKAKEFFNGYIAKIAANKRYRRAGQSLEIAPPFDFPLSTVFNNKWTLLSRTGFLHPTSIERPELEEIIRKRRADADQFSDVQSINMLYEITQDKADELSQSSANRSIKTLVFSEKELASLPPNVKRELALILKNRLFTEKTTFVFTGDN